MNDLAGGGGHKRQSLTRRYYYYYYYHYYHYYYYHYDDDYYYYYDYVLSTVLLTLDGNADGADGDAETAICSEWACCTPSSTAWSANLLQS